MTAPLPDDQRDRLMNTLRREELLTALQAHPACGGGCLHENDECREPVEALIAHWLTEANAEVRAWVEVLADEYQHALDDGPTRSSDERRAVEQIVTDLRALADPGADQS